MTMQNKCKLPKKKIVFTLFTTFLFLFYFILFIFFEKKPPLKKKVSNEYRRKSKGQEKDSERLG